MGQEGTIDVLSRVIKLVWSPWEKEIDEIHILRTHYLPMKSSLSDDTQTHIEVFWFSPSSIIKDIQQNILEKHYDINNKIGNLRSLGQFAYDAKPIRENLLNSVEEVLLMMKKRESRVNKYTWIQRLTLILTVLALVLNPIISYLLPLNSIPKSTLNGTIIPDF